MCFHIHYTFYIPRYFNITIFKIMLLSTGQRMVRHGWREWTIFVLNSNTVYRSIILGNSTESKKFIKLLCKLNECENIFTATEATYLSKAPKQNWPPDSTLPPNANPAGSYHSLVRMSCYRSQCSQNLNSTFPHRKNGRPKLVESSVTDSDYYIRSKLANCQSTTIVTHTVKNIIT
jgi:hypothetical protein